MNFNRENFKLSMRPEYTSFFVNGTNVTCKMFYILQVPDVFFELCGFIRGEVTATAYCHEDDTFDLEKGRKVALAKAETLAYREARKVMREKLQKVIYQVAGLAQMAEAFDIKTDSVVTHNKEFIKRITD